MMSRSSKIFFEPRCKECQTLRWWKLNVALISTFLYQSEYISIEKISTERYLWFWVSWNSA